MCVVDLKKVSFKPETFFKTHIKEESTCLICVNYDIRIEDEQVSTV